MRILTKLNGFSHNYILFWPFSIIWRSVCVFSDAYTKLLTSGQLTEKYATQFTTLDTDFAPILAKICFLAHFTGEMFAEFFNLFYLAAEMLNGKEYSYLLFKFWLLLFKNDEWTDFDQLLVYIFLIQSDFVPLVLS